MGKVAKSELLTTESAVQVERKPSGQVVKERRAWAWGGPLVPDDHGAYAMLLMPMLLGLILGMVSGVGSAGAGANTPNANLPVAAALYVVSDMCLFLATEPLGITFKPHASARARLRASVWLGIYLLAAGLSGIPLLFVWGLWALGWFLVPAAAMMLYFLVAVKLRKQRSIAVRLPGIAGLTLSAPAAYYVATGALDAAAWGLWAACAIYFAGTFFNVRAWFEANRKQKGGVTNPRLPAWLVASILFYIAVSALLVLGCVLGGALPRTAFLAFVPSLLRAGWTLWRTPAHLPIKTVGLIEFGQSFLFALLLIATVIGAAPPA